MHWLADNHVVCGIFNLIADVTLLERPDSIKYSDIEHTKGDKSVRIAICDDESEVRARLRQAIFASKSLPPDADSIEFSNGAELLKSHTDRPFEIIFLDIQMEGMSGLEVGHEIRNTDKNVIIIFITGYQKYVFESFKIEAFDYIMKPIEDATVADVLRRALKKHKEQHYIVQFKCEDSYHTLHVSEIIYIECHTRRVKIATENESFYCFGKLNEYEKRLTPYGFLRCHQNNLVNMSYIKSIEKTCIVTATNENVDMSVRKRQDCLKAFNTFLAKYRV